MRIKEDKGLSKSEQQRYSRHLLMGEFGIQGQVKLKNARILVVGAGGLGCPCLLYLAAAGVGFLGIADDDVVSLSNLQRQVLYRTEDIGKPKADTARFHLLKKNPLIHIQTHSRIKKENVIETITGYDLVIDGSDNFNTRYLLSDACVQAGKPYIYGAVFKFEGQVSTFNYQNGPTYRCLYSEAPAPGEVPSCGEAGVLGVLPGIVGTWQAAEAIKVITGIGQPLSGQLLILNLLTNDLTNFSFKVNPANRLVKNLKADEEICVGFNQSIGYEVLKMWLANEDILLIDVREKDEFELFNIGGLNIPLAVLDSTPGRLNLGKKIVLVCQTGIRSFKALHLLKKTSPESDIYDLKGGLESAF